MKTPSYRAVVETTGEPIISSPTTLAQATSVLALLNESSPGSLWIEVLLEGDPVWHEVDLHDGQAFLDGEPLPQ